MTHRHVVLLLSIASATIVACGGGAPPPMSPDAKMEREAEPATVEEALARIERARVALGGPVSGPPATGATSTPARPATPIAPNVSADSARTEQPAKTAAEPPRASSKKPGAPAEPTEDGSMQQRVEDRCASPCRALVSMRRAVAALCRMTGDTDTRCVDAKKTLADSEGRVSPCSC